MNDADRLPVPSGATPSLWMFFLGGLIDVNTLAQQAGVLATMALCRGHEADGAMTMLVVVPSGKGANPLTGREEVFKRTLRIDRAVFQGLE